MLTLAQLSALAPSANAAFLGPLNAACERFGITTPARLAAFLAQALHESAQCRRLRENLNYSAEALLKTFPRHFDANLADECARQPKRIANRVYANRLGNGDEASGDGWRYRGGGLFGLTFKDNYRACSLALNRNLVGNPEWIETPEGACLSAAWYWATHGFNTLADEKTEAAFLTLGRVLNGSGTRPANGEAQRLLWWSAAKKILATTNI